MRRLFIFVFTGSAIILPLGLQAAGFVPCNGPECQACNVVELVQNIITWMITRALPSIFAVLIAVAGFKMATSGGNEGKISEARHILSNIVIGLVIILAAWVIVDTVLKTFLKKEIIGENTKYGPWNQIECIAQPAVNQAAKSGVVAQGGAVGSLITDSGVTCDPANTACSATALQQLGLNSNQANVLSCLAMTESGGNPNTPPYNTTHPTAVPFSSACGTFQITQTTWETSATGACADFSKNCMIGTCNAQVAATLVQKNGYKDWTCVTKAGVQCNPKAQNCVNRYGG